MTIQEYSIFHWRLNELREDIYVFLEGPIFKLSFSGDHLEIRSI